MGGAHVSSVRVVVNYCVALIARAHVSMLCTVRSHYCVSKSWMCVLWSVFLYKWCINWLAHPCLYVLLFYFRRVAINDVVIWDFCWNLECRITHFSCKLIRLQCSKQQYSYGSIVNKEVWKTWWKLSVSRAVYSDDSCSAGLGFENYAIWSLLIGLLFIWAMNVMWLIKISEWQILCNRQLL